MSSRCRAEHGRDRGAAIAASAALARRTPAAQGHRRAQSDRQHRRVNSTGAAAALFLWLVLPLSGCGWERLYADPATGPASADLRAIRVAPIAERIGQRLEMALRNALNPTGQPTPYRYTLATTLSYSLSNLGLQSQGTRPWGGSTSPAPAISSKTAAGRRCSRSHCTNRTRSNSTRTNIRRWLAKTTRRCEPSPNSPRRSS